jgi:hypothetical protein
VSVLAQLERLDHRLTGSPEAPYVYESRKWRLRYLVISLLTFVSLTVALASSAPVAGWLLVLFALATGVKTALAQRAWRTSAATGTTSGRWYEH